jgi:hypothetical protein
MVRRYQEVEEGVRKCKKTDEELRRGKRLRDDTSIRRVRRSTCKKKKKSKSSKKTKQEVRIGEER